MNGADFERQLDAEIAAFATLANVRFDETAPFDGLEDAAGSYLHKAHALSLVLSNHIADIGDKGGSSRGCHLAGAIDAISHFIALAHVASRAATRAAQMERAK